MGSAKTLLVLNAGVAVPNNDLFGRLIYAKMHGALYELISFVRDCLTGDMPRLLQRIQALSYTLPDMHAQSQQTKSEQTLRESNDKINQDWGDDN